MKRYLSKNVLKRGSELINLRGAMVLKYGVEKSWKKSPHPFK